MPFHRLPRCAMMANVISQKNLWVDKTRHQFMKTDYQTETCKYLRGVRMNIVSNGCRLWMTWLRIFCSSPYPLTLYSLGFEFPKLPYKYFYPINSDFPESYVQYLISIINNTVAISTTLWFTLTTSSYCAYGVWQFKPVYTRANFYIAYK